MIKYVIRFLPEYNCTSLWPENEAARNDFDMPIDYKEIGLSVSLINDLEKFDDSIMTIIDWNNPGGASPLSNEEQLAIYNEGKRLLLLVRNELKEEFEVIDCIDWLNTR